MRKTFSWLAFTLLAWPLAAAELNFDFSTTPEGKTPSGFHSTVAGQGQPGNWQVLMDNVPSGMQNLTPNAEQTSKRAVLGQLATDPTDEHFPILMYDGDRYADFTFTTHFKIVSGAKEQMAGVAFRIQDEKNFYVIRASALGNNLRFYKMVDGVRSAPIGPDVTITPGVWHELKVQCQGDQITSWLDGQALIPSLTDDSFTSGKVGLWTKSDSVTYFGDTHITYTPREPEAQQAVREVMGLFPKLINIVIYAPKDEKDGAPLVAVASKNPEDLGQVAPDAHQSVMSREVSLYRPGVENIGVVMPLRDRDGEVIGTVEVTMKRNFLGQTEGNALARALPVVKQLESRILESKDLTVR